MKIYYHIKYTTRMNMIVCLKIPFLYLMLYSDIMKSTYNIIINSKNNENNNKEDVESTGKLLLDCI